jgi:hypothetical protein
MSSACWKAEPLGPDVHFTHFWSWRALDGHQQLPQAEQQREFGLGPLGAVRQRREERQPFGDGGDGILMGIAPGGVVSRLPPIVHGPLDRAGPLEVDGELDCHLPHPCAIPRIPPLQLEPLYECFRGTAPPNLNAWALV